MLLQSALRVLRNRSPVPVCDAGGLCLRCYDWVRRNVIVDLRMTEEDILGIVSPCRMAGKYFFACHEKLMGSAIRAMVDQGLNVMAPY